MSGREDKKSNDLFFVCSLIDYISRKTKNRRKDVVDSIGNKTLQKIYDLADIYHSDNIDTVSDQIIESSKIVNGGYDNVADCEYSIPSHWDIGKVYKRLILGVAKEKKLSVIDALFEVYHSFISGKIDDYNSSFYYENPDNILISFLDGRIE